MFVFATLGMCGAFLCFTEFLGTSIVVRATLTSAFVFLSLVRAILTIVHELDQIFQRVCIDVLVKINVMLLPFFRKGGKDDVLNLRFCDGRLGSWKHVGVTDKGLDAFGMIFGVDSLDLVAILCTEILDHGIPSIRLTVFPQQHVLASLEPSRGSTVARRILVVDDHLPFGECGVR